MSRDRLFPKFFGRTHESWGTPWVAILIMGVVNAVLINFNFSALITIDVFLLMFPYVLIYLTAMILRVKEPDAPRPFRVPLPTWALGVWVAFPIAIAIIALFVNGTDWMIGGLAGMLTGPIAYLVFKNIYKGTTDEALEGSTITPRVSSRSSAPRWKEARHEAADLAARAIAASSPALAAIGGGLYARSVAAGVRHPAVLRHLLDYLSGVHVLVGLGDRSWSIGGLLGFKWPSVGGVIVCVAAMIGLIYTLRPRPVPLDAATCTTGGRPGCSPGSPASSPATRPTRTCRRAATKLDRRAARRGLRGLTRAQAA